MCDTLRLYDSGFCLSVGLRCSFSLIQALKALSSLWKTAQPPCRTACLCPLVKSWLEGENYCALWIKYHSAVIVSHDISWYLNDCAILQNLILGINPFAFPKVESYQPSFIALRYQHVSVAQYPLQAVSAPLPKMCLLWLQPAMYCTS